MARDQRLSNARIVEANRQVIDRIFASEPMLLDVGCARENVPGMRDDLFLHSGPPIGWDRMCPVMKAAAIGAAIYEGLASTPAEADMILAKGEVEFSPTHHHNSVAPMAGIISKSMPVFVVKNETMGNFAYSNINEGVGRIKTLRFGANDADVINRLKWIEGVLGPALSAALKKLGRIELKQLIAEAIRRGDECHNRNKSATSSLFNTLAVALLETELEKETIVQVLKFIASNVHFFLNISMASSKATMDSASNVEYSTIVTAISSNGPDFGIRVSGLGDEWFTARPPRLATGKIFEGFTKDDAGPFPGDSSISEPAGIGASAMAAAPAISEFVGGTPSLGLEITKKMYKITFAEHDTYKIPYLNYRGTPVGIDLRKVLKTGIVPAIDVGVAHKKPGIGQIGAGIAYVPRECFEKAARAFQRKYGIKA